MDETPTTIRASDLIGAATIEWHEGLAIVLQLADAVNQLGVACVPDLPHVQISGDGTLAILPGCDWSAPAVKQLAVSLRSLLEHAAVPSQLAQAIVQAADGGSPEQNIDGFVEVLRYFERPGRQAILRAVVERVVTAPSAAHMEHELERLMVKARGAAPDTPAQMAKTTQSPATTPGPSPSDGRRSRRPRFALVLALLVLLGVVAAAWLLWASPSASGEGAAASVVKQATRSVAQAFDSTVGKLFGQHELEAAPSEPDKADRTDRSRPRLRANAARRASSFVRNGTPARKRSLILAPTVLPSDDAALLVVPHVAAKTGEADAEPARIYGAQDPGVRPPVPVQPSIGHITNDNVPIPGDMDIIVGRNGEVERVTLLVPNGYQDRMLIYAMKNRKFVAADADGRPVPYRLRVRTAFQR